METEDLQGPRLYSGDQLGGSKQLQDRMTEETKQAGQATMALGST